MKLHCECCGKQVCETEVPDDIMIVASLICPACQCDDDEEVEAQERRYERIISEMIEHIYSDLVCDFGDCEGCPTHDVAVHCWRQYFEKLVDDEIEDGTVAQR